VFVLPAIVLLVRYTTAPVPSAVDSAAAVGAMLPANRFAAIVAVVEAAPNTVSPATEYALALSTTWLFSNTSAAPATLR